MNRSSRQYDLEEGASHSQNISSLFKSGQNQRQPEEVLVLDKDGKPCRTCHDFKTWAKLMKRDQTSGSGGASSAFKATEDELEQVQRERLQCPVDKDELGKFGNIN